MRCIVSSVVWVAALLFGPASFAGTVGFAEASIPDGRFPPLQAGIWYPAQATPTPTRVGLLTQMVAAGAPVPAGAHPLVVMSHGQGGDFAGHADTAFALAEAGFVVAAPTHTGDNWRDASRTLDVAGRSRQLSSVIDWMIGAWHPGAVDPARVGGFGFSAGGLTVLIEAGGIPDLGLVGPHCAAHPDFFDCRLVAAHGGLAGRTSEPLAHERRLRAIVVAAPALGFTFDRTALRAVSVPVQLWRAADDVVLPAPYYADAVRSALPTPPQFHLVAGAGHFDFLAPCSAALARVAPIICVSEPGFDRVRFHDAFNKAVVTFFETSLGR